MWDNRCTIHARTDFPKEERRLLRRCTVEGEPLARIGRSSQETMASTRLPVFDKFISDLRAIWAAETDNSRRMERAKPVLEKFVMEPSLKAHSANWPSTEGHKNLLLYVDPEHDFVDQRGRAHARPHRQRARPRRRLGALRPARRHREPRALRPPRRRQPSPATPRSSSRRSRPARRARSIWCRRATSTPSRAARPARSPSSCAARSSGRAPCCRAATIPRPMSRTEGYGPTQVPYDLVG